MMLLAGIHEAPVRDWIRQHLALERGDIVYTSDELDRAADVKLNPPSLETLCSVPCPDDLCEAQRVRLMMGTLRYGACGRNYYDAIGSCLRRLEKYVHRGGNREHLVDIANLVAIEWLCPNVPTPQWLPGTGLLRFSYTTDDLRADLAQYLRRGNRRWLVHAVDCVRREWYAPTVANAHWNPQDCGGHWSLRNS